MIYLLPTKRRVLKSLMLLKDAREHGRDFFARLGVYPFLMLAGTALAVLIRISLFDFKSSDFLCCYRVWYYHIQTLGFRAFRQDFSAYNPPYLYVLYLIARFAPNLSNLVAVKLPSIVADFVSAGFVHEIVRLRRRSLLEAFLAYVAALFAPTVLLNGAWWGQTDSLYAVGLLACVYCLLTRRRWLAMLAFGVALSVKLQSAFLLPFLVALWLRGQFNWKHWLAVPAMLALSILPAWLVGRPLASLAAIYLSQGEYFTALTMYAPTLYTWLPSPPELFRLFFPAGLVLAITVTGIFVLLIAYSRVRLSRQLIIQLAALCVMLVPFVTPKMHERYFYPADLLSIAFAFYSPSYFYVALVVNMSSFFSYVAACFGEQYHLVPVPETWLALAMLSAIGVVVWKSVRQLYPNVVSATSSEADDGLPLSGGNDMAATSTVARAEPRIQLTK